MDGPIIEPSNGSCSKQVIGSLGGHHIAGSYEWEFNHCVLVDKMEAKLLSMQREHHNHIMMDYRGRMTYLRTAKIGSDKLYSIINFS